MATMMSPGRRSPAAAFPCSVTSAEKGTRGQPQCYLGGAGGSETPPQAIPRPHAHQWEAAFNCSIPSCSPPASPWLRSRRMVGYSQFRAGHRIPPCWDAPTHRGPHSPAKAVPAPLPGCTLAWGTKVTATTAGNLAQPCPTQGTLSSAVGLFPWSRIPQGQQTGFAPRSSPARRRPSSPPRGEGARGGTPTLETVMGFPKSLPPVMRKPQGAGPAKVTVTGMAAGGSGRAGSGSVRKPRGAKGTRQRGALSSLHEAQPARWRPPLVPVPPRVPNTGLMEAFLPGRGPTSSHSRWVPAATAASSCLPGAPG